MSDEPLRIIELEIENVKRLKSMRLKPDKTLVRIEGRNAQGKTSVLDAICACLGGGKWQIEKAIREGEKKARTKLDMGDLQVERQWKAKGVDTLVVTLDGVKQSSPQTILDKLIGDVTFDPLAFVRMKPKDQEDILRRLAGLDFNELDAERKKLYEERTATNRETKSAEARCGTMPPKPKGDEPINVRELADKQQAAIAHNRGVEAAQEAAKFTARELEDSQDALEELQSRVAKAEEQAKTAQETATGMTRQDIGDLGAEIAAAELHNQAIKDRADWERVSAEAKALAGKADEHTTKIEAIEAEKERILRETKFPLTGLGLGVSGVTLNGIPFSQASSAEQLRCGVAIGLAQNKRARLGFVRDGSLLDDENLQLLHDIAAEFNAQVFVERVAEKADRSAVYIEDGEIANAESD